MRTRSFLAAVAVVVAGLAMAAQSSHVTGTIQFGERVALPTSAAVYVTLEDISRADARPIVVASTRIAGPNQPPIPFDIVVDTRHINPAHRYAVRATIVDIDRVMFTTENPVPVLTQGHGTQASLVLKFVAGPKPPTPPPAATQALVAPSPPSGPPAATPRALPSAPALQLPATFTGMLPCADCPGIRYELDLFADDAYFLRTTYVGRSVTPVGEIGSWTLSSDERMVVLGRGPDAQELFEIRDADTLRALDVNGEPIGSRQTYDLRRTPAFRSIDVRLPMRGAYRYLADAGLFTECTTGQTWPVAAEGANRDLEAAYSKAGANGEPVLVAIEGQVTTRPSMESAGLQRTLVVEKFVGVRPDDRCAPRFANASLTETDWRLTWLMGHPVTPGASPNRAPRLTLAGDSLQFSASTGCTWLIGRYDVAGDGIGFSNGGTLTTCPNAGDAGKTLMAALEHARSYRVLGHLLELRDADGTVIARGQS